MKPAAFASRRAGSTIPARSRPEASEGITLLDHPGNPHPRALPCAQRRLDGRGVLLPRAVEVKPGAPLRLRYGLYVHAGMPEPARLQERWEAFAKTEFRDFAEKKKP